MDTEALIQRYFECLNTEAWEAMGQIWHEDAELRAVGARPRRGREEVVDYFRNLFNPWPEHRDEATRVVVAGSVATVEVSFTGTTADGRTVSFDAVDVFDIEDGLIKRLSNWYDIDFARRKLDLGKAAS